MSGSPYALFMKSDDIVKRAAELRSQITETRAKAEEIKTKMQQLENTLNRVEQIAKQVHAKIRRPMASSNGRSSPVRVVTNANN